MEILFELLIEIIFDVVFYFLFVGVKDKKLNTMLRPFRIIINLFILILLLMWIVSSIKMGDLFMIFISIFLFVMYISSYVYIRKKYLNDKVF